MIQWEVVTVSDLPKVTPSVVRRGTRVWAANYRSTAPLRTSFLSLQFWLPGLKQINIHLPWLAKGLPACHCSDFLPQGPSCSRQGQACPRIRQALCPAGLQLLLGAGGWKTEGGHQRSSLGGRRGRKADRADLKWNSKCQPLVSTGAWLSILSNGRALRWLSESWLQPQEDRAGKKERCPRKALSVF